MKYLECCIDEALRLYPILPMLFRTITKDYRFPNSNVTFEKGTAIFIPILGIQRDPTIYENPLEFRPERFINSSNGSGNSKGLFYMPFGDGPRKLFINKRIFHSSFCFHFLFRKLYRRTNGQTSNKIGTGLCFEQI